MSNKILTKSDFNTYLACPESFWYTKHKPELLGDSELDSFAQQIIEQGNEVESWAQKLFPNAKNITTWREEAIKETQEAIEQGTKLFFQPAFQADGLKARIDVLKKNKRGWDLYEVKGSSSKDVAKSAHVWDAAFQYEVLKRAGMKVHNVYLIEIDSSFIKEGDILPEDLLKVSNITHEVEAIQGDLLIEIDLAKKMLRKRKAPISCSCILSSRNNHCAAFDIFNPDFPDYAVHDLSRVSKKKLNEFYELGITEVEKIPADFSLTQKQQNQVETYLYDSVVIDKKGIQNHLSDLDYPIYFLDYETFPAAIPKFDGCRPYQQVPFQYSLHIKKSPRSGYTHKEFLHTENSSPLHTLAETLCKDIGPKGSIIVWNKGFEMGCNRDLAKLNPKLADQIHSINDRVYDLMEIFSKQLYVHKDFRGSASIKKILPVLCEELTYDGLNISSGGLACSKWGQMIYDDISQEEKNQIADDLLEYCKLDTWAMVRILEEVRLLT